MTKRVCVIGGGISGLCVAYGLRNAGIEVVLFEKTLAVGGNIRTEFHNGFLVELGANSTLASRELVDLTVGLGIYDQIAQPSPSAKKRFILRDGNLVALPSSIAGLIANKAFSTKGKLRILKEPLIGSKSPANESVEAFFERRLGREIVDYAVDPFISGIYAGNPKTLSIRHAFPRLFELEVKFGSLLKGSLFSRQDKAAKLPKGTPRSITFTGGMQTMTDAIHSKLADNIRVGATVSGITKASEGTFQVETGEGNEVFDSVVVCTPAGAAAEMLAKLDPVLAEELRGIYYPPIAVVFTAFKHESVMTDPAGFGFLVPGVERRKILGSLWTSSVFENRAPTGYHLFTTFIGGARNANLALKTDDELINIATDEIASILGTTGEPVFGKVVKWEKAIPQYNIGYESVVGAIETFEQQNPGIFICSNFYKGISVSDCIKNSTAAKLQILNHLGS